MATAQNLLDTIEVQIRDYTNTEITEARLLILLNAAALEAGALGWVYPLNDAAVTLPTGDGSVAVPASYAWIDELRLDTNDVIVPRHYWKVRFASGDAVIKMEDGWENKFTPGAATAIGWKRLKSDYGVGDTIEAGLEAFLTDRTAAHALRTMVAGGSELDRARAQQSEIKMRDSQAFLENIPNQYRILPTSRYVPGR